MCTPALLPPRAPASGLLPAPPHQGLSAAQGAPEVGLQLGAGVPRHCGRDPVGAGSPGLCPPPRPVQGVGRGQVLSSPNGGGLPGGLQGWRPAGALWTQGGPCLTLRKVWFLQEEGVPQRHGGGAQGTRKGRSSFSWPMATYALGGHFFQEAFPDPTHGLRRLHSTCPRACKLSQDCLLASPSPCPRRLQVGAVECCLARTRASVRVARRQVFSLQGQPP